MKLQTNDIVARLIEKVPSLEGINALNVALFIMDNPSIQPQVETHLDSNPYDVVHDLLGLAREDDFFVPRILTNH